MRRPSGPIINSRSLGTHVLRGRLWLWPLLAMLSLWLPAAGQGWLRTDSHYYAAIASQAFATGELVALKAGDQPYLNKPPFAFWVHGAVLHVFGVSVLNVRLPALLAAAIGLLATIWLARVLMGWRAAMLAGIVLGFTLEYVRQARAFSLDLWMTAMVMLGAAVLVWGGLGRVAQPRGRVWQGAIVAGAGVCWGMALLTKPMVAMLVPVLMLAWASTSPAGDGARRRWLLAATAIAALVAICVAGVWHVEMWRRLPGDFVRVYLFEQSVQRGLEASEAAPWWLYFRVLAEGYWPWLAALVIGLVALAVGVRPRAVRARSGLVLAGLSVLVWLVVLSVFGGKSPRYLVIVYPMLAMLVSVLLLMSPQGANGRVNRGTRLGRFVTHWAPPIAFVAASVAAVVGVRVHEPIDPAWSTLLSEHERLGRPAIRCTPAAHPVSANLALLGPGWPALLTSEREPDLRAGDMLMMTPGEAPPRAAREVARSPDFVAWRLD
jgi:4-amino-4-deoxy-L-arabinose transferase-like glycosyltransferase